MVSSSDQTWLTRVGTAATDCPDTSAAKLLASQVSTSAERKWEPLSQRANRGRTTRVDYLIQPPELPALIEAKQDGRPVDDAVFAEHLGQSVAEIVHQQVEPTMAIVRDGEFEKACSLPAYVTDVRLPIDNSGRRR